MKPNNRLKQERETRGWSQAKLAELVGTNPATIGRWERGISLPYPIYRERLSSIFNKNLQELGFLAEDDTVVVQPAPPIPDPLLPVLPVPQTFVFDPAIPMFPLETGTLIGRDELLLQLKRRLCGEGGSGISAFSGLPGVGKTTLTLALAYDREVQEHFSDGILWAGLGTKPDVQEIQGRWGVQLGLSQVGVTNINGRDDWARTLRGLIGTRHMLLIVDDVWEIEEALAFQVGGPHCVYLLTTRFPQIAIQIAGNSTVVVSELNEDNGIALLAHFAPHLVEQDRPTARRLVNSVGALPLALVLMGRYLRFHTYNEQPRRLRRALQDLGDTEKRMQLNDLHGLSRPYSSYSGRTRYSLQSVIALSDERLGDVGARLMLRAIAVFPPKPNTFSEEAAVAVSEQPAEMLDLLCDTGLLESSGPERYMMHQTIADYARTQMGEDKAIFYERMILYIFHYIEIHKNDYKELELEYATILAALEEASRSGMEVEFMQGVNAIVPFLRIRGLYNEAIQYLEQAYQIAQGQGDSFEKMEILSHLGQIMHLRSEYRRAEDYLSEGLHLARVGEQAHYICLFLAYLGEATEKLGEDDRAETFLQEGLSLARQLDMPERISQILMILNRLATNKGVYTEAERMLSEALQLARQLGHKEYMLFALSELGVITLIKEDYELSSRYFQEALVLAREIDYREAIIRLIINLSGTLGLAGDYEQCERYLQEGLQLSHQIGNQESMALLLNNLGSLASIQGNYAQAQAYLQEGLVLAYQMNHPWLICTLLQEQGDAALLHQHYEEAQALFTKLLTQAAAFSERYADAHYGLARAMAFQGNLAEAQRYGEISAEIFEASGLPKAQTIRNWLTALPTSYKKSW